MNVRSLFISAYSRAYLKFLQNSAAGTVDEQEFYAEMRLMKRIGLHRQVYVGLILIFFFSVKSCLGPHFTRVCKNSHTLIHTGLGNGYLN